MKPIHYFLLGFLLGISASLPLRAQQPVGINLSFYQDWTPEFLFKDAFKGARVWTPANSNGDFPNISVPQGPNGYPAQVPFDAGGQKGLRVRAYIFSDLTHGYPSGDYTLRFEGTGTVRIRNRVPGSAWSTFPTAGTHLFSTAGDNAGLILEITQSDASDPVHNIRHVMPGFAADDLEAAPFHPQLLEFLEDFECVRWMDLMRTNASPVVEWDDRTLPTNYVQTLTSGVAYEYLAQLCNTADVDVWVNVPHQASDDYIMQFAHFLENNIGPERKIYVEYSNEVWNGGFPQQDYAALRALELGIPGDEDDRTRLFYALRSAEIFEHFEDVFDDDSRLVKVIAHHDVSEFGTEQILDEFADNPGWTQPDALAIAPYMGRFVGQQICNAGTAGTITIPEVLGMIHATLTNPDGVFQNVPLQKQLADEHGLQLFAYEGGQHLDNGAGACDQNSALTQILANTNRDLGMGGLYCEYLNFWYGHGGGLFMHFNSHSEYSQHGSFGLKEYLGQPDAGSPKMLALLHVAQGNVGCIIPVNEALTDDMPVFQIFPNPNNGLLQIRHPASVRAETVEVCNLLGHRLLGVGGFPETLDLSHLPAGVYLLVFKTNDVPIGRQKLVKH